MANFGKAPKRGGKAPAHLIPHRFKPGHVGGKAHPKFKPALHKKNGGRPGPKMPKQIKARLSRKK